MDINVVFMWVVRGFDGVVNTCEHMLAENLIPGDGPIQHCVEMHEKLGKLIERMIEVNSK